jgi:hypothetical protein
MPLMAADCQNLAHVAAYTRGGVPPRAYDGNDGPDY